MRCVFLLQPATCLAPRLTRAGLPNRIGSKDFVHSIVRYRCREKISLTMLAFECAQLAQLFRTADSFCFGANADYLRERQNRSHEPQIFFVGIHRAHEVAIDLDGIDWQPMQINQGRIAGAEIVQINLRPELLDLTEECHSRVTLVDQCSFGNLEAETAR